MLKSTGAIIALLLFITVRAIADVAVPSDWVQLAATARSGKTEFTLRAPPGTLYVPQQGIDSFVGDINGSDFRLGFDYGAYTNDMSDAEHDGSKFLKTQVDGREALLVAGRSVENINGCHGYFVGFYMRVHGRDVLHNFPAALGLFGCAKDAAAVDLVWTVFRTIHVVDTR